MPTATPASTASSAPRKAAKLSPPTHIDLVGLDPTSPHTGSRRRKSAVTTSSKDPRAATGGAPPRGMPAEFGRAFDPVDPELSRERWSGSFESRNDRRTEESEENDLAVQAEDPN